MSRADNKLLSAPTKTGRTLPGVRVTRFREQPTRAGEESAVVHLPLRKNPRWVDRDT